VLLEASATRAFGICRSRDDEVYGDFFRDPQTGRRQTFPFPYSALKAGGDLLVCRRSRTTYDPRRLIIRASNTTAPTTPEKRSRSASSTL